MFICGMGLVAVQDLSDSLPSRANDAWEGRQTTVS